MWISLETEAVPARGIPAKLCPVSQCLGQGLASSLRQEERGQSSNGGAQTENQQRENGGDFGLRIQNTL